MRTYHWSLVTRTLVYMFLLTSPLNVYGLGSGAFNYRFSRIFLVLAVLAVLIERLAKVRSFLFKLCPFEYLLGIYSFLAFSSIIYVNNYNAFATRFFGLVECILILYLIRIFTHEEGYWRQSVQIYLLSSLAILLASAYQVFNAIKGNLEGTILPFASLQLLDRYEELGNWEYFGAITAGGMRVSATFSEPNMLAGYCASLIPFAIVMVLICSKEKIIGWRSFLNLFVLVGLAVMVIAALSKAGFLSMLLGIALTLEFGLRKCSPKQKQWLGVILTSIIFCCLLYGIQFVDLIADRLRLGDSGHIEYSLTAWNEYIGGSWFWGEGFGQYIYVSAHTIVLTALLELGLIGGLLIIMITVQPLMYVKYLFLLSSRLVYDERMREYLFLMSASFASFTAIIVGLYLYDYWMHPFTWISIALFISLASHVGRSFKRGVFAEL